MGYRTMESLKKPGWDASFYTRKSRNEFVIKTTFFPKKRATCVAPLTSQIQPADYSE